MTSIEKRDGFQDQIQYVIPAPIIAGAAKHILVSDLYPTDIGRYPKAKYHNRQREAGAGQNILIVCTAGAGWCEVDGRHRSIQKNEALIVPKGQSHRYGASQSDPWTIQWVHFAGEHAPYYLTVLRPGEFVVPVAPDLIKKLDQLFADAYDVLSNGFSQQGIICTAQIVQHILGLLFFNNKAFSPNSRTGHFHNLDTVIQFMKDHIDATLTIQEMARKTGLSAPHFSRLFSRQVGFPPMDYFIHLKIQHACRFLTLTPLSIKEIAARLGYTDQYYFSRAFHKVMGSSPMAYRRIQSA